MTGLGRWQTPSQLIRFVVVGGINTILTGALFVLLSLVLASTLAYTIAFLAGIAFAVVVTPRAVFRARPSYDQRVRYVVWYLTVFAFGFGLVYILKDRLELSSTVVAGITFVATASLSFLGARTLFRSPSASDPAVADRAANR